MSMSISIMFCEASGLTANSSTASAACRSSRPEPAKHVRTSGGISHTVAIAEATPSSRVVATPGGRNRKSSRIKCTNAGGWGTRKPSAGQLRAAHRKSTSSARIGWRHMTAAEAIRNSVARIEARTAFRVLGAP